MYDVPVLELQSHGESVELSIGKINMDSVARAFKVILMVY